MALQALQSLRTTRLNARTAGQKVSLAGLPDRCALRAGGLPRPCRRALARRSCGGCRRPGSCSRPHRSCRRCRRRSSHRRLGRSRRWRRLRRRDRGDRAAARGRQRRRIVLQALQRLDAAGCHARTIRHEIGTAIVADGILLRIGRLLRQCCAGAQTKCRHDRCRMQNFAHREHGPLPTKIQPKDYKTEGSCPRRRANFWPCQSRFFPARRRAYQ